MNTPPRKRPSRPAILRGLCLALAVVALLARIGSPPGTMFEATSHGARLVACSGHGPMTMAGGHVPNDKSRTHSDGSCEFAGHAGQALIAADLEPIAQPLRAARPLSTRVVPASPGSGLAAPPPPSHAPPLTLV